MRRGVLIALVLIIAGGVGMLLYGMKLMEERMLRERDGILKNRLADIRQAIRAHHDAHERYPTSLEELVPSQLPAIPVDPITRERNWRLITEETVTPNDDFAASQAPKAQSVIIDVKSAAAGSGGDGVAYADY